MCLVDFLSHLLTMVKYVNVITIHYRTHLIFEGTYIIDLIVELNQCCLLTYFHILHPIYFLKQTYFFKYNYNSDNCTYIKYTKQLLLYLCNDVELNPGPHCNLEISHLNVRSLRNKIDMIESELYDKDILCLTETHLTPNIPNSDININSFSNNIHRVDRKTGLGDGIIIYCKNTLNTKRREDLEHEDLELIWLDIFINNKKILLGCIYRPESNVDCWNKLEIVLEEVYNKNTGTDIIITDDINLNMLNIPDNHYLSRLLTKFNLNSIINEPTRVTDTTSTAIDIPFTNSINLIRNTLVSKPICSDKSVIHFTCSYSVFK